VTGALLTLAEFRRTRDQMQLASMRDLRPDVEAQLGDKVAEVNQLLDELEAYPAQATGIQYHLTKPQFDERMRIINAREKLLSELDVKQREWAALDSALADIDNAIPVIESRLAAAPAVVSLLDSVMATFGFKKAAGE
jgi:hypothetical protein